MHCTEAMAWMGEPAARRLAAVMLCVAALAGCTTAPPATVSRTSVPATAQTTAPQPPALARDWEEFKVQAAQRMVAAHPQTSYLGVPPEPLLGIPVLEVELNADGSVREVVVVREPREAKETIAMAVAIVHKAAPYGPVGHLPRPWRFVEVFLFDDDYRFKPATLDR